MFLYADSEDSDHCHEVAQFHMKLPFMLRFSNETEDNYYDGTICLHSREISFTGVDIRFQKTLA